MPNHILNVTFYKNIYGVILNGKINIYILYIMTGYSMVKNDKKINQLGYIQQTILNNTISYNDK